jgi:hypothetical protein
MILFADLLYAKQSEEKKMCICTQPRWHPLLIQEVVWQSPTVIWAILLHDLVAALLKLCSLWLSLYAFSYLNSLQVQKTCSIPSARLLAFVERRQSLAWPLFTPNLNHTLNVPDTWFHFLDNLRKHRQSQEAYNCSPFNTRILKVTITLLLQFWCPATLELLLAWELLPSRKL